MTNAEIAKLLRKVSAAYLILGENRFRIIAYDRAADSVEHLTREVKNYWEEGKLEEIPGVGKGIADNLDELFTTGKSKHWDAVLGSVPEGVFPLLLVPGIGPKKAYSLVTELHLKSAKTVISDLEKAAKTGKIASMEGFGEKSQSVILESIQAYRRGQIKENRMPLPLADAVAQEVISYIKEGGFVNRADVLGSLRRKMSTIGDVDIAVATTAFEKVLDRFVTYPHQKIVDRGTSGATLLLHNGRQVDLRVQKPEAYGAMLQYFTGSKNHNIKLREYALKQGKSLSEHGIKSVTSGILTEYATEEGFYKSLGLSYIEPELREDHGEIEASAKKGLPALVAVEDIKGDVHVHSDYDLKSSHDIGRNTIEEMIAKAHKRGYQYIGFSDHNPSATKHKEKQIVEIMKRRKDVYEHAYSSCKDSVKKRVQMFLMCEVDIAPDGTLALPFEAMEYVDAVIVSVHSSFAQEKKAVTKRLVTALTAHPKVRILGHPTGRLLGKREGIDADWQEVMDVARQYDIALEINAYPDRLDLPDVLVHEARERSVRFCINTDAHATDHMDLMPYGVSVARRGWATKDDIVNTLGYNQFEKWLRKV